MTARFNNTKPVDILLNHAAAVISPSWYRHVPSFGAQSQNQPGQQPQQPRDDVGYDYFSADSVSPPAGTPPDLESQSQSGQSMSDF